MPLPRSFKTDESFLEKIAIGATGTRRVIEHLRVQGHSPIELERGSTSFKIWKAIKIKRLRVPDILCLKCGRRAESRAKTKMEISMSHSTAVQERGWDFGLNAEDVVALAHCKRVGQGPLDWSASQLVQYISVAQLRKAWDAGNVMIPRPKGAGEGFEIRATWPAAIASDHGVVEGVDSDIIRYRRASTGRLTTLRLNRRAGQLQPLVSLGHHVEPNQIVAAVIPVQSSWHCSREASLQTYIQLSGSTSVTDRYTATKALAHITSGKATDILRNRLQDTGEHIYVRLEAASGLMRADVDLGPEFFLSAIQDEYLENRLEAVIVLSEVGTEDAVQLLLGTLQDDNQHPEIRAGAAWSLGEIAAYPALTPLVDCFNSLEMVVKIEAARALAKIARSHQAEVIEILGRSDPLKRPGIAWALSKAGGFTVEQVLSAPMDNDAREWVAYIIGTQDQDALLPEIEKLSSEDPELYFAVTVLWKILSSWTYGLEEH